MEERRLGSSDLEITRVGIGTAPIGSSRDWWVWWGRQDEGAAIRAIQIALDAGVNWIDTAPFYGWGRAEELVGRALRGRRDEALVFTKCGTLRRPDGSDYMDLRPETIRREVEASLRRLGIERLDLLQIHDRDPTTPIEETWSEIQRLIEDGKVRHGGISNHRPDEIERALTVGPVAGLQLQYNVLVRDIEHDLLPFASAHGLGVLAWSPLASGFLTDEFSLEALDPDDFRRAHPFVSLETDGRLERVRTALRAEGGTAARGAIGWVLGHSAITAAIVGVRDEHEAAELPALARAELRATERERIAAAVTD